MNRGAVAGRIGLLLYSAGLVAESISWYDEGLAFVPTDTEILFNKAVSLERLGTLLCFAFLLPGPRGPTPFVFTGKVLESAAAYNAVLFIDTGHARARLNIAALHHLYGSRAVRVALCRVSVHVLSLCRAGRGLTVRVFA
jgi:hypothetical protein